MQSELPVPRSNKSDFKVLQHISKTHENDTTRADSLLILDKSRLDGFTQTEVLPKDKSSATIEDNEIKLYQTALTEVVEQN